jgi:peptidoglycan/xylan/chitin deacetylase (PgdA/CDA1 family)
MPMKALILALFVSTACGGLSYFIEQTPNSGRSIASDGTQELLAEEEKVFNEELDEKLSSLNSYYLIAQKNLQLFDESISDKTLEQLYQTSAYLNLLAVKTQVEGIEHDLVSLHELAKASDSARFRVIENKIDHFSKKSSLKSMAMSNLRNKLGMRSLPEEEITGKQIEKEYLHQVTSKEFQIYEKNIEHLSHLMEMNIRSKNKKFKPATTEEGNLTGEEFPPKVWALTFDNGPDERTTSKILQQLQDKNLKATFFQLAIKSQKMTTTAKKILKAGMEIGSNSHSYKELTKVGPLTLEKEITAATKDIENSLKVDIKFFRLPFGSGVNVPAIRETIAKNNLIHVNWNIDTLDWMAQTSGKISSRAKRLMKKTFNDSGIILFHDIHNRSIQASAEIMDHLKLDGRRSCTIGKIVNDMNEGITSVCLKN